MLLNSTARSVGAILLALSLSSCATVAATMSHSDFPELPESKPVKWKTRSLGPGNGSQLLVPVLFDGHEEYCLLDTGATGSIVFGNKFFKSYSPHGNSWLWGVSGEKIAAYVIEFKRVEIGGRAVEDLAVVRNDRRETTGTSAAGYDCVVGLDVLGGGTLSFDFRKSTFQILKAIPEGRETHPLKVYSTGHFAIPVALSGHPTFGLWDSGASLTVLDPEWIGAHRDAVEGESEIAQGLDVSSNAKFDLRFYRLKRVSILKHELEEVLVAGQSLTLALNLKSDVLLGYDLISRFNWMFDLRRARFALY